MASHGQQLQSGDSKLQNLIFLLKKLRQNRRTTLDRVRYNLSIEPGRPTPFRGRVNPLPRPKRLTKTCAYGTLVRVSRGVKDSASTARLAGSHACGRSM